MKHDFHPSYLLFILILSILAIVLLAVETIFKLNQNTVGILRIIDIAVCVFFFVDFLIMFFQSRNKTRYFFTWGWLDLLSSIPMINSFRWGRLARILRIFRVLRGLKSAKLITQMIVERRAQSMVLAIVLVMFVLISISSISVLHFEKSTDSPIRTPGDALWWSVVTIATVGYSDFVPVTIESRVVALLLRVFGVGLFGMISGLFAAWFIRPVKKVQENDIQRLDKEVKEMKRLLKSRVKK